MIEEIKKIYDKRVEDLALTLDFKEPSRVPVCTEVLYWPLAYSGVGIEEIQGNPKKHCDAFIKVFDDMYTDAIGGGGVSVSMDVIRTIGAKGWFVSSDGVTVQHNQDCVMQAEEYDNYIADPVNYPINVLSKRKFEKLNASDEDVRELLKKACKEQIVYGEGNRLIREHLTGNKGIVYFQGPGITSPVDFIFDYIRGFRETLTDMRRYPKKLEEACRAYYNTINLDAIKAAAAKPYPPVFNTAVHALPFINKKQFEDFWWKFYKPQLDIIAEAGGKLKVRGEGFCEYSLDYFADYPKGMFIWQFDQDDPYKMYEKYGDKFIFQCGIENNQLKINTKEECIDVAKKAVDTFAPGGGFIFSTAKIILCGTEIKAENIIAVHDFVHEYGKC